MNIGKNIAIMRKHKRMSQEDLANKIGIHRVALSNIERGETSVSFDRVLKICECLNVSIDDLIHADELSQPGTTLSGLDPTMASAINDITQSFQLQMQQLYLNRLHELLPICTKKAIGTTVRKLSFDVGYILHKADLSALAEDQIKALEHDINQYFSHALKGSTHVFTEKFIELIDSEF